MNNQELIQKVYELVRKALIGLEETRVSGTSAAGSLSGGDLKKPLILTSGHGVTCHQSLERLGGGCALQSNFDVDLGSACCVVLYDLSLDNLFKLVCGCTDNDFTGIAARALLEGIKVYAVREGIELFKYGQDTAYSKMLGENLRKLQNCGVVIIAEADLDNVISGEKKPDTKTSECGMTGVSIDVIKKVLTETDVKQAQKQGACEIFIPQKAVITCLASEYAVKRGITITRRSNFSGTNNI